MKQILFIHRSVGENLIIEGEVYKLIHTEQIDFKDLNQNNGQLRSSSEIQETSLTNTLENTTPKDFAKLFISKDSALKNYALSHNIVVIKSCYPNSNIKSETELEDIKKTYQQLFEFFSNSSTMLVILSSPPLRYTKTTRDNSNRARALSTWLMENQSDTVRVFNLFDLLAEKDQQRANTLKRHYQRFWFFDSHPNKIANQQIAPKFVSFLSDLCKTNK